jgi:hypothetical protein
MSYIMNDLLTIATCTVAESARIAFFQSAGERLPASKGFAALSAALSAAFTAAEQMARGHGIAGMLIAPVAWLFVVWTASLVERKIDYRIASALLLGSIPVCVGLIMFAGYDLLELAVAAWGTAVMFNVLIKQNKEWSLWR